MRAKVPLKYNNRVVSHGPAGTTVTLHGKPCVKISPDARTVELSGEIKPTRKSCRLFNAILSVYTGCRTFTRQNKWFLETADKEKISFTDQIVSIPATAGMN